MNKCFWLVLFCTASLLSAAQTTITLQQAMERAELNSPLARQIHARWESSRWMYRSARAFLTPQLGLNGDFPGYQRRINQVVQPDGTFLFIPVQQALSSGGLSLSQQIPFTGGSISLESRLSRGDIFGDQGSTFWQSNPLLISLNQPVFRFNALKWQWRQEKLRLELAGRQQAEQLEELRMEVIARYFDWYIARLQLSNAEQNRNINDTIYRIAKGRFGVGKIAENELLQVELSYTNARNAVEVQQVQVQLAQQQLERFTGKLEASSIPTAPVALPAGDPDPSKARDEALSNRSDNINQAISLEQARRNLSEAKLSRFPQANINLSYGLNQTGSSFDQALQAPVNSQFAGLGFSMPIFGMGSNRAAYKSAQYAYEAAVSANEFGVQQLEAEVIGMALQVSQLKKSVGISAKADTIARKRFEVAGNRYRIGTVDITNLLIAQSEKDMAFITYMNTLRDFWMAWYRLRRLTLYDFEKSTRLYVQEP